MATILDGKLVRDAILASLKPRIERLTAERRPPGLAVVMVGSNPASEIYVRNKVKACAELGIAGEKHLPLDTVTTEELLFLVEALNRRPDIDGILIQLPLPEHIDQQQVLASIDPSKDVDGFHPCSVGDLVANRPGFRACTPAGVMRLLEYYGIPIAGKDAVVVGRSDIVGKPMAFLLLHAHATVTICHSKTANLAEQCRRADILIAAMGRPAFLTADFIKPGAVVVDVGINRLRTPEQVDRVFPGDPQRLAELEEKGSVIVGDVHPEAFSQASFYTPVPGGVGPLTIAMLMSNTVDSAERRLGIRGSS
ncbi:MAG: bifunctional methylenetetrahydrofolate dehydrogenase/methenyltetrahydrofolate cyclohydrolase FolD [Bryobacteraceae bacterium]|nr:bifunctional methylenetetrahydrofolate dehydrogenase/methenyltetrahydrofolate cyclohydrolase FolD [Bryobacteraceae bacterium]MDW8380139.1 bifunctional methylenetetrahydrofolate dehydrogenase/methenyltetrahydrofolate cyclohydrolase FolD [Bryobacterales bacterium]